MRGGIIPFLALIGLGALAAPPAEAGPEPNTPSLAEPSQFSQPSATTPRPPELKPEQRPRRWIRLPLLIAAKHGQTGMIKFLVSQGKDVNDKDDNGTTALHLAAGNGQLLVTNLLIELGAVVNEPDSKGIIPLHEAATRGDPRVVKALLENGAFVNAKDRFGRTPLHMAESKNKRKVADLLREHGATR